ncbi:MAG: tRNA (N6-isopentenyl adenosine(37)-C2)-methylthiotransferase MiaB [Patescibacteria group bacterium]|nr:tRNA (N6-isopentenyl adenosine(37)-C2)-methylthiotransferase MiaB [Patescibacteria group bacterium]MDD4304351.1 tRNA (N6-isopentenyl adenosine(37)-C2)-methylthiotransferase MiaB [Patescibacteria group bacterium]MDD4695374.1 tRNA (N6-isopentenyl adenosine(37)-C2)-methylthiotransferase MiaB [Patescibacteria group bacterium]
MNYYIKYFGCDMNKSDAERVSSILESLKYKKTDNILNADVIVVLACSVRQTATDRIYGIFKDKKLKKSVIKILTGCVLKEDTKKLQKRFDIIIDITKINNLSKLISKKSEYNYDPKDVKYFNIIPNHNNYLALVPISNGCNNFCTYCAVPYTRGLEKNRSAKSIINEIKSLPKNIKQIMLLGQTVNSYVNPDKSSNIKDFSDLLEAVAILKPDTWITFISPYPTKFDDKLIKVIAKYKNISHHIHIPLQSGNDRILQMMNRRYDSSEFLEIISKIYKNIPDANITTDVIVGFPTESEKDFNDTLAVLKKTKVTLVYSGLYSPRPGTVSYKIYKDNVEKITKRKRDEKMTKIIASQSLQRNKKYLGNIVKVLVQNKNNKQEYLGKMQTYETVKIKGINDKYIGQFVDVKIDKALNWRLEGEVIK